MEPSLGRQAPGRQAPNTTNVLTLLLGVALVVAVVLLVISLKPAGPGPAFSVTAINADACPAGEGAPACFQVLVENSGAEAAHVRCELTPAEGTTALFFSGDVVYTSAAPIDPQQVLPLSVKVDVTAGNDTVVSPTIACSPLDG